MKALMYLGNKKVEIKDIPKPDIKEGQILLKIKAVGICMTDLHVIEGLFDYAEPPCVLGHEIAGVVEEIPQGETRWKIGDRVCVETMVACGHCHHCLTGYKNLCTNGGDIGFPPYQGGYAEYISVPSSCLYKLPDSISFEEAAILESFICPVGSLMRLPIKYGDSVLIQGLGPAGLAYVQGARAMGATNIIVSDSNSYRLELAKKYGAHLVVDYSKDNVKTLVYEATQGKGVDVSIEASGSPIAVENAITLSKPNANVIFYGIPGDDDKMQFPITEIILKQLNIFGASGAPWAWERVIDMFDKGIFNCKEMVSRVVDLEDFDQIKNEILNKNGDIIKTVVRF